MEYKIERKPSAEHKGEAKESKLQNGSAAAGSAPFFAAGSAPASATNLFATELFLDLKPLIALSLVCPLCQDVCAEVTESHAKGCGHLFCLSCITTAVKAKPECPLDRVALLTTDLKPSQAFARIIDDSKVRCLRAPDCKWTGRRGDLAAHLNDRCDFAQGHCSSCHALLLRGQMASHAAQCPRRLVPCPHCGESVVLADGQQHLVEFCEKNPTTVTAPLGEINKLKNALRAALAAHRKEAAAHAETRKFSLLQLEQGDVVDARDKNGAWMLAEIVAVSKLGDSFLVHFRGWSDEHDEWIAASRRDRFAPAHTRSAGAAPGGPSFSGTSGNGSGGGSGGAAGTGAASGSSSAIADDRALKKRKLDPPTPCKV